MKNMERPTFVSLFAGCGGMDRGLLDAGFTNVWANDFDRDAQAVYRLNLGEIDGRDIREVNAREIPACDLLTAGFPCQPFSNAGLRRGVFDARGELYLECLRIMEAKRPKAVLFENVKGLLSSKHRNGRSLVEMIRSDLEGLGYTVNYKLLDASGYGVPQRRERLVIVGTVSSLGKAFTFPAPNNDKSNLTLRHVLDLPKDLPNQEDLPFSPQARHMVKFIPQGGSWKDVPYDELPERFRRIRDDMKKYHSPKFYRRFGLDEINGTVTASAQPEKCGIIHPLYDRRFSVREVARIQTFPDDFLFITDTKRNITAMYKVIGNAVPCKLAEVLGKEIKRQFFGQ